MRARHPGRIAHGLRTAWVAAAFLSAANAFAGDDHDHGEDHGGPAAPVAVHAAVPTDGAPPAAAAVEFSEGEIVRLDAQALQVTLRHGELKNLNMPPITMVFSWPAANSARGLKAGDKVRFRAEQVEGGYHVTHIEKAP